MKTPTHISHLLLASAFLTSSLCAQDIDTLNKEVKQLEKQLKDLKGDTEETKDRLLDKEYQEKQKRIAKNIALATARTQKNIAKGTKSEMYKRVLALQEQRATYLKGLAEGSTRAFPNVVENWEFYQSQVAELTRAYQNFQSTESSDERAKLAIPLYAALQPIGPWLDNARHSNYQKVIATDEYVSEHEGLQKRYQETRSAGPQGKMKLTTPGYSFTLKHLPVPIQFVGPVDSEVLLYSEVGGTFPNGLSYTSVKTDDKGLASTSWVSKGEAVATCSILYRGIDLSEKGRINISVKQLSLLPLDQISPVFNAANNKLQNLKK